MFNCYFQKDCPKGELDKKKFISVYKEFFPLGKAETFATEVFKIFDTDHSGKIEFVGKYFDKHSFPTRLVL